jgi:MEMO1 family protein
MDKPILRNDIRAISGIVNGRQMLIFQDPLRLCESNVALDMRLLPVLQLLDGRHDLYDIQLAVTRQQNGILYSMVEVKSLLETLDQMYLLDSGFFREKLAMMRWQFSAEAVRRPVHAGKSYPAEAAELKQFIEAAEEEAPAPILHPDEPMTGLIAPHIDVQTARRAYAHAYRHLTGRTYDTVIIFGINHNIQEGLYCISDKDYETPLGELKTDKSFVSDLRLRVPEGTLSPDDFGQKMEHSIEFQAIFLRHYLGANCAIVPILCGSLHYFMSAGPVVLSDERFMGMVSAVESLLRERGQRTLLVAGVDFSHIGMKFGDPNPAEVLVEPAMGNDRRILSCLETCETDGILDAILESGDQYKVCGFPALLIFSRLLRGSRGRLLVHDYYDEKATASGVSYASMIFTPGTGSCGKKPA